MRLRFKLGLKFYITFAVSVALFILSRFVGIFPDIALAVSIALTFIFIGSLEIELSSAMFFSAATPLVCAILSFVTGQFIVSVRISYMSFETILCNIALTALLYYLLLTVSGRFKLSVIFSSLAFFLLYIVNYALILFRGREIALSDFYSVKNAAGVVSNYKLTLTNKVWFCVVLLVFVIFFTATAKFPDRDKIRRRTVRAAALGCAALCAVGLFFGVKYSKNYLQNWGTNGTRLNGVAYNLIVEMRESRVEAPDGYSADRAKQILSRYNATESVDDPPHIIVIMNEAFSDLSVLGDFEISGEPLEYFNSLSENAVHGWALSSVLGGNTATSEWEFLTGNSAAFVPYGSIAYQQYIKNHAWSMVDTLKRENYTAVAMHPYTRSFWQRDSVYEIMGFDEMYFIDELTTSDKLRGFVTDKSFFGDIINRFESRKNGEKLFMFNITMQNHGGYKWGGFEHTVTTGNEVWAEVDQYLTLTDISDDAFKGLIEYFEKVEDKVMIVMFGDHQPSLPQSFYTEIFKTASLSFEQVQKKQTVPFIIWTNYETDAKNEEFVGLNTLSALVLERAGIALPPYFAFLSDMRTAIPAMNAYGYYSPTLQRQARTSEAEGEEAVFLEEYRILQYNNLFDTRKRAQAFEQVGK